MDYRKMFDSDWLRHIDLDGQKRIVTIVKVEAGELENHRTRRKDRKPVVLFKEWPKPLGLNKTNAATIAGMYGNDTTAWIGKRVTLFPTTTQFGNETKECIRIEPKVPTGKPAAAPANGQAERQPGED